MRLVVSLVFAVALLCGCGLEVERTPSEAETAASAARFGGIVLPADMTVLAARHDNRGPDESFRVVLQTDPDGARQLVDASGLTAEPQQRTQQLFGTQDAGPALVEGPGVASWKNEVIVDGRRRIRDVVVDSRAAPVVYVHLLLFET